MSDSRCRACGAALPPNATWCSLCFADLRPATPAPVRETATVAATPTQPLAKVDAVAASHVAAASVAESVTDAVIQPPSATATQPSSAAPVDETDPLAVLEAAAAEAATPPAPSPTWPCPRCGAKVPMDMDFCNECGAGFLSGVANGSSVRLPVVGEVKSMSSTQRLLMGMLVAIALMAAIVALGYIGGHLFN